MPEYMNRDKLPHYEETIGEAILRSNRKGSWNRKQRRYYHRFISGLKRCELLGRTASLITLTSSPKSDAKVLNAHWEILRKRIVRRWGVIGYAKIRTEEGCGVIHAIVWHSDWIPKGWLSQTWLEIHRAEITDIRRIRGGESSSRRLSAYLVSNYLSKHGNRSHLSWSANWLWKGAVKDWRNCLCDHGFQIEAALKSWNKLLGKKQLASPSLYSQSSKGSPAKR